MPKIILDIDALQAFGDPNLTDDELADLAFNWGVTILHELNHVGDKLTNGKSTGGQDKAVQPKGTQFYGFARPFMENGVETRHRGMDMEMEFFGSTFTNSTTYTNDKERVGMAYGDLSKKKSQAGLDNLEILGGSNIKKPKRRTTYVSL